MLLNQKDGMGEWVQHKICIPGKVGCNALHEIFLRKALGEEIACVPANWVVLHPTPREDEPCHLMNLLVYISRPSLGTSSSQSLIENCFDNRYLDLSSSCSFVGMELEDWKSRKLFDMFKTLLCLFYHLNLKAFNCMLC